MSFTGQGVTAGGRGTGPRKEHRTPVRYDDPAHRHGGTGDVLRWGGAESRYSKRTGSLSGTDGARSSRARFYGGTGRGAPGPERERMIGRPRGPSEPPGETE